MRRPLLLLVPLALVAAGCAGGHDMSSMGSSDTTEEEADDHDDHDANSPAADDARTIEVAATSFEFDPDTIEVDAGEDIAIELAAEDAEHDFVIDELELHVVAADKGERATGGFTAPSAGTYTFYCSVAGHRGAGMEGTLVVR